MKDYFYIDTQNQQHGPIAEDKLLSVGIKRHTLVWCQGMTDWLPAETVPELRARFDEAEQQAAQPEPQPQPSPNEPPPYQQYQQQHQQQQQYQQQTPHNGFNYNRPPYPNNYMVWAVLSTICCCLPLGIVAIVKANQVSGLYYRGYYDEAYLAAEDAKKWSIIALIAGLISCCGSGLFNLYFGMNNFWYNLFY